MNFYDFKARSLSGKEVLLEEYKGKVVKRFAPVTKPKAIEEYITKLL